MAKDLGIVTAYGYAVQGGYTGTEAQFMALLANARGIVSIENTSTSGAVHTYTITYTDGTTQTYNVTDGEVTQAVLDAAIADVKTDLTAITEAFSVLYTRNKAIKTNTNPVVLEMVDTTGFSTALVPCVEGDVFIITGRGGAAAHFAVFVDSSGNILDDYGVATGWRENVIAIAPANASYLILNNYNIYGTPQCYKGLPFYSVDYFDTDDFEKGGINATTGEEAASSLNRYRSKNYIDPNTIKIIASANNKVAVFAYNKADDSYVGVWNGGAFQKPGNVPWLVEVSFAKFASVIDVSQLKYRIAFENGEPQEAYYYHSVGSILDAWDYTKEQINELKNDIANVDVSGNDYISDNYYTSDDEVSLASSSTELYALYDELVANYPNFVTKNTLTSEDFTNYEYVFGTNNYNDVNGQRNKDTIIPKPAILLITGVHGDEKSSIMSTYSFLKSMCENKHPLSSILQKLKIRVLPCVNPWGFDNNTRWNSNGVNINRNFNADWIEQGTPFTNNYSGTSAGSEKETKIVQSWIDNYIADALMLLDFHNSGYANEVSYIGATNTLDGVGDFKTGYRNKINEISGYWIVKREMVSSSLIFEYTGQMNSEASCQRYGTSKNKLSATLETSWNQNGFGLHSAKTIGIGAEVLACVIFGTIDNMLHE